MCNKEELKVSNGKRKLRNGKWVAERECLKKGVNGCVDVERVKET